MMEVFAEMLGDDVGLLSLAVFVIMFGIIAFFVIFFLKKVLGSDD
ncbi:MAG: DUF3149 domain-containing protein [Pseudomonadota bacterium]